MTHARLCERCSRTIVVRYGHRRSCMPGDGCRRLLRDLVGCIGIMRRAVESRGGAKFRERELVLVEGTWRGGVTVRKLIGLCRVYCPAASTHPRTVKLTSARHEIRVTDVMISPRRRDRY